jgi:type II secretion system protein C
MDAKGMRGGRWTVWWVIGIAMLAIAITAILQFGDQRLLSAFGGRSSAPATPPSTGLIERPVEIPPPLPGGDSSVSDTPRALLLVGTQVGAHPTESLAFLGVDRRNPQTYAVGALLANGARITAIAADHIILARDGKSMRLDISRERTLAKVDQPMRNGTLDVVGGPPARMPVLQSSIEAVTEVIRPSPVFDESGRFIAYRLQPGAEAAAFARLGLVPGDRLVSVDGMALADVAQAAQALQSLAGGSALAVTVLRGGQAVSLRLDGQILSEATTSAAGAAKQAP